MKKHLLSLAAISLAIVLTAACKAKPADTPEPAKTEIANITAEYMTAFLVADDDTAPAYLDSMGIKRLNYFYEEGGPGAQCPNEHSYYGRGAKVELNENGGITKLTPEDENAVVIHVGGEGTVNGYFAFRSEEDYNNFVNKVPQIDEETQVDPWLEVTPHSNGDDCSWLWELLWESGFEKGKWYVAEFFLRE